MVDSFNTAATLRRRAKGACSPPGNAPGTVGTSLHGINDLGGVSGVANTGQQDGTGQWVLAEVFRHMGVWGNFPICCWLGNAPDINNGGDAISLRGMVHFGDTGHESLCVGSIP